MSGDGYTTWLRLVDAHIEARVGLSHRDLADRNYRDEYDAGTSPREAALEAIADEPGGEAFLDELSIASGWIDGSSEIAGAIDEASGAVSSDAGPGL